MNDIRVLVTGAGGKMGQAVVAAVTAADGMYVAGIVDPAFSQVATLDGVVQAATIERAVAVAQFDVLVDFTVPTAVEGNVSAALDAGIDCVVGTTGLSDDAIARLSSHISGDTCLFIAPNFAIGAVLMMRFAQQAARFMGSVEIVETHHPGKVDAPSGTALRTAELIGAARRDAGLVPAPTHANEHPARGADVDGTRIHSVRLPGMLAHQEVVFGDLGQALTIRHDTFDRSAFMPGVVAACRAVGPRSGVIIGLENLLEM